MKAFVDGIPCNYRSAFDGRGERFSWSIPQVKYIECYRTGKVVTIEQPNPGYQMHAQLQEIEPVLISDLSIAGSGVGRAKCGSSSRACGVKEQSSVEGWRTTMGIGIPVTGVTDADTCGRICGATIGCEGVVFGAETTNIINRQKKCYLKKNIGSNTAIIKGYKDNTFSESVTGFGKCRTGICNLKKDMVFLKDGGDAAKVKEETLSGNAANEFGCSKLCSETAKCRSFSFYTNTHATSASRNKCILHPFKMDDIAYEVTNTTNVNPFDDESFFEAEQEVIYGEPVDGVSGRCEGFSGCDLLKDVNIIDGNAANTFYLLTGIASVDDCADSCSNNVDCIQWQYATEDYGVTNDRGNCWLSRIGQSTVKTTGAEIFGLLVGTPPTSIGRCGGFCNEKENSTLTGGTPLDEFPTNSKSVCGRACSQEQNCNSFVHVGGSGSGSNVCKRYTRSTSGGLNSGPAREGQAGITVNSGEKGNTYGEPTLFSGDGGQRCAVPICNLAENTTLTGANANSFLTTVGWDGAANNGITF